MSWSTDIINCIPELLQKISEAQKSIGEKPKSDNDDNTTTNNTSSNNNEGENNNTRSMSSIHGDTITNDNISNKNKSSSNNGSSINCFSSNNTNGDADAVDNATAIKNITNDNISTKNEISGNKSNDGSSINCFSSKNNNGDADAVANATAKDPKQKQNEENKSKTLHLNGQLEKLRIDLNYVQKSFKNLKEFENHVVKPLEAVSASVEHIVAEIKKIPPDSLIQSNDLQTKLRELDKIVMNLKVHIPSSHKMYSSSSSVDQRFTGFVTNRSNASKTIDELPVLSMNKNFQNSSAFNDFLEVYNPLDFKLKLCLLCFSAFPEKSVVKRRILMYWWIGEGLIVTTPGKTVEDAADEILVVLAKKGFIEPVNNKHRLVADSFTMHPLIRSAVIMRAKEVGFFDFDDEGNPTANFESSHRACLIGVGSSFRLTINNPQKNEAKKEVGSTSKGKEENHAQSNQEKLPQKNEAKKDIGTTSKGKEDNNAQSNQEKLCTLYNVNEQYLKLEPDWFLKLKNVQVLQLGRWMSSAENHIEVEDIDFLKRLKNMKLLMYFSLQGISRISELPDTIGCLTNLRILDLRACHNLELLPKGISSLKNLTHLDLSECYLLDSMPKEISQLSELQVLKGFVIGDGHGSHRCTLDDLKSLLNLRKLSISTGLKDFPTNKEVKSLQEFKALRKLKIAWGGSSLVQVEADSSSSDNKGDMSKKDNNASEPAKPSFSKLQSSKTLSRLLTRKEKIIVPDTLALPTLEKVDLQCFPHTKRPSWLKPSHLTSLKKLYIRGGRLSDLSVIPHEWTVEILCLKYLYELTMDWTEMKASFPQLKYLEMVKCPKLTFCPCDDRGVWLKKTRSEAVAID